MKALTTLAFAAALCAAAGATATDPVAAPLKVEGKVTGTVKFDGKPPELKPLGVTDEKAKGCTHGDAKVDATDPKLIVSKEGCLANVVVFIEVEGEKAKPSEKPLEIDQKSCSFRPHVRVVPAGSKVVFLNSDEVSHNVHTYATKNDSFNKTIAPGSKEEQMLAKGDKIQVKCDIHDWMSAWIFVADTPYAAVTGEDGSFTIEGLKPGKYKVELWHETLGKGKAEATVKEDGSCEPLEIKMGEKKKKP